MESSVKPPDAYLIVETPEAASEDRGPIHKVQRLGYKDCFSVLLPYIWRNQVTKTRQIQHFETDFILNRQNYDCVHTVPEQFENVKM